jgi:hypothetical protein
VVVVGIVIVEWVSTVPTGSVERDVDAEVRA